MKIKTVYPVVARRSLAARRLRRAAAHASYAGLGVCLLLNLWLGGKAWSAVVAVGVLSLNTLLLSPDLVELNRISLFIKSVACACTALAVIDVCLSPGWAVPVLALVGLGSLVTCTVLFFTDMERQRKNMMPMMLLIFITLPGSFITLGVWHGPLRWALLATGCMSALLLIALGLTLGKDFLREFSRRFHMK